MQPFALAFAQPATTELPTIEHDYDPVRQLNVLPTGEPMVANLDAAILYLLTNCQNPRTGETVYNDD